MPMGSFIAVIPPAVFMAIHIALFLVGAYLAYRSFDANIGGFGWGFTLYAIGELFYLSYHMDVTVILFAHTIAEVLNAAAMVLLFSTGIRELAKKSPAARPVASPMGASAPPVNP